ncbi:MAG: Rne/Rng family ribonuclease [Gammaproteobacteria bacterium]|nr:Rne/Rng family ribonuclease [Gammaproteobacteria bacterium]
MDEDLLINVSGFETRVALLQNHVLTEVHLQRSGAYSLTGNIYKGRVERILPGMQAAFVNIGVGRPGFLHARDIETPHITVADPDPEMPDIRDLVTEGQAILVQIAKDPIASKGARLTTQLALASRFLVHMPFSSHLGISQRIDDEVERERLRTLTDAARVAAAAPAAGVIVRTAAEGATEEQLNVDFQVLQRIWQKVSERAREAPVPALVYEELPIHTRVIRDLVSPLVRTVQIDDASTFERVKSFAAEFVPEFVERIIRYDESVPLFDRYGVEDDIDRALGARVPLRCGGHLVIEQTEAMTTVDVNTGGFVGARNLEDTVFRANLEAAAAIPRQLRLRNLGGIIVIDFIDMVEEDHQRQVLRALEKACEGDPGRIRISPISALGLVEMSRKRTRESLARQLCKPCESCHGRGVVKTPESVCFDIFRAIARDVRSAAANEAAGAPPMEYLVRACQDVVDRLLDEERASVACLVEQIGRDLRFQVEPSYTAEQFDVVLVRGVTR